MTVGFGDGEGVLDSLGDEDGLAVGVGVGAGLFAPCSIADLLAQAKTPSPPFTQIISVPFASLATPVFFVPSQIHPIVKLVFELEDCCGVGLGVGVGEGEGAGV